MEYRKEGEMQYTPINGDMITGLEPGIYYVRRRAKPNYKASAELQVVIKEGIAKDVLTFEKDTISIPFVASFEGQKAKSTVDGAVIRYTVSTPETATINRETGELKILQPGVVIVTAKSVSTATLIGTSACYTLIIAEPIVEVATTEKTVIEVSTTEAPKKEMSTSEENLVEMIPFAENVPLEKKETIIKKTNTDQKDVAGSTQKYLFLKATAKKNSIKLTWKKINGADAYLIYGAKCGSKMEPVTTIEKQGTTSWSAKKLKKGTYYKYMVVAYKKLGNEKRVITTSKSVHVVTDGGKKGNPTTLKLKKSKLTVKVGKKQKIQATYTYKKKVSTHIAKFRYESDDPQIATVTAKGEVKGVSAGKTTVYIYLQNGICKKIPVTVK